MTDITLFFRDAQGSELAVPAIAGQTVMAALEACDLVAGECGGALACASCHVWLGGAHNAAFPPPSDHEEDMLDTAFHVTERSRLACQLVLAPEHNGMRLCAPVPELAETP